MVVHLLEVLSAEASLADDNQGLLPGSLDGLIALGSNYSYGKGCKRFEELLNDYITDLETRIKLNSNKEE